MSELPLLRENGSGAIIDLPFGKTECEARQKLAAAFDAMGLEGLATDPVPESMRTALLRLPALWKDALAPSTLRSRRTDLRRFAAWCVEICPEPFESDEILTRAMEDHLSHVGTMLSSGTVRRISSSLTALAQGVGSEAAVRGACERRRLSVRAAQKREAKGSKTQKPRLSVEQMGALATAIKESGHRPIRVARDTAILSLMADILARRAEIEGLRLSDLDLEQSSIFIARSKTDQEGKGVRFSLSQKTVAAIEAWVELSGLAEIQVEGGDDLPLFTGLTTGGEMIRSEHDLPKSLTGRSIARILGDYGRSIGVVGVAGHTVRRSMAKIMHDRGIPEEDIMRQGRWGSIEQMRSYVGIATSVKGVADLVF